MLPSFKVRLAQHCFQINKRLCVKGLLVARLVYCDSTKGPRDNTAPPKEKKIGELMAHPKGTKKKHTKINDVHKVQFRKCQNSIVKQGNCKGSKITVFKSCS